jgi:Asp-tRNA(Asn)/Glu-tRNA(Gln) amidotransferase A subunit family amidase
MSERLHALSLIDAAAALRSGLTTSESLTRELLDRIAATDANVQAWAYLDTEAALDAARRSDGERAAGSATGLLAGIGIGVKDVVATADQPTQLGSPIYAGARPMFDAECVQRLRGAGGFVLGKTVTTEFAFLYPGKTRNPWNAAHTPGGSSSGSAAAVALGQVAGAIGTQTNGSVIRPAAYCGVVGFKPTLDALPFAGINLRSPTLDTLGVFARSVADCALLAACLAEPGRIAAAIEPPARPPRLAVLDGFPWVAPGAEQERAMHGALSKLRDAGAILTTAALPGNWHDAQRVHRLIMLYEAVPQLGELQARERARMSDKLNAALDEGREIGATAYAAALGRRAALIAEATEWMAPFDAIASPPVPAAAPADLTQTGDPSCCTFWSLLGFPAASIPIAMTNNGLPLGLQLAASAGGDERLLAVTQWCEACLPFGGLL